MSGPWDSDGKTKAGGPRALNCPSCGAPIVVRAAGASVSIICGNCGSTLDSADPALAIIRQSAEALARPAIALGTRGVLAGVEWEVVGYLERSGDGVQWQEYLLFNPWEGYRFLVHGDDDWRLGQMLDAQPDVGGDAATLDGRAYDGGEPYDARVDFVVGEFYWRVAVGETVTARDYSAWGGGLSREANGSEVSWTRLDDVDARTVAAAFGLSAAEAPTAGGESPADQRLFHSIIIAAIAIMALFGVLLAAPSSQLIASDTLMADFGGPAVTRMIGPIVLARAASAVRIRATTDIDNAWVDLDYALVERRTQQRYEASATAEYYRGVDSDGSWSEGDERPDATFASIPRGTYDLIVEAKAQRWSPGFSASSDLGDLRGPPAAVTIGVTRDAGFASSIVLAILLIIAWPGLLWAWSRAEKQDRDD